MKNFINKPETTAATTDASGAVVQAPNTQAIPPFHMRPDSIAEGSTYNPVPQRVAPMWETGSELDLTIVVSPSFVHQSIAKVSKDRVVLEEKAFKLGDKTDKRVIDTTINIPKEVQNNGTLWGHFYLGLSGSQLEPSTAGYDPTKAIHFVHPLTQYLHKKKVVKTKNLLSAGNETEIESAEEKPKGPIIRSFYHPNFTMSLVPDAGVMNYPGLHPAARQYLHLDPTGSRDSTGQNGWYAAMFFINTFWQLRYHMTELNSTVTTVPFHVDLNNQANWLFSILASVDEGAKNTARQAAQGTPVTGGSDGSEFEMIKEVLLDTNIYLLGTTVIVSILHMLFEMLAFTSDLQHFRKKKDNVGISVRSILGNVFMQGVIFLYLLDNNENTSWMILFSQGMGIALEFWKVTTVVNVRVRPTPEGSMLPYTVTFEDKHKLSETEEKTQEYDAIAFRYLYMIAVPLLFAYAIYSLIYDTHKSWYSFVITTLVGSVYAYGFLMMVPSLYINYRLKSVAHMPAKAMTYKFLNTFIDDLFAFTIKMPTLHRLATLRDDVIFFVYLYQSYKYKVDYVSEPRHLHRNPSHVETPLTLSQTRVNEFGQGGDDEPIEEKLANKPLSAPADADGSIAVGKEGAQKADEKLSEVEAKVTGSAKQGKATRRK